MKTNTSGNSNLKIKVIASIAVVAFILAILVSIYKGSNDSAVNVNNTASGMMNAGTMMNNANLPTYTVADLKQYNGTDPNKPIYIGMNGYVYDVSSGSSYYKVGGSYHFLAGKDSSKELNLIGGDIIKRKYPVVGILK